MRTTKEAADYLGVSPRRIVALINSGHLAAAKASGVWLIGDTSLEERAKNPQRHAGRPRKGSAASETRFLLKNRTYDIAELIYDSALEEFTSVGALIDADRAPLGLVDTRKRISTIAFNTWWRNRGAPEGRLALIEKLEEKGLVTPFELSVRSLGLSLSDQFWICPESSGLEWDELNFFNNGFGKTNMLELRDLPLRNPDNTSEGVLPKHWIIKAGQRHLLKGGRLLNQEPYNEVVATALHRRLLKKAGFVKYQLESFAGLTVSSSRLFVTDKEEYIPAYYVIRTRSKHGHHSDYQHYQECCYSLGVEGIELSLAQMILCDDILANTDRHYRNFGIIRNVETLLCRPAPLFDSGTSLWCNKSIEELKREDYSFESKPFNANPGKQLSLISDLSWVDIGALEGFVSEAVDILAENNLMQERMPYIEAGLKHRTERISNICRYL